jgi:diacylglycerol kinase (ATP)
VTKRACIIVNPAARSLPLPDRLATAPAWLRLHGWRVEQHRTARPGDATELARAAAAHGCDVVVAVGGDGTLNEVVNGLATTPTALAVIPAGTANVWAREARLPRHPAAVARLLDHGVVRRIDLGRVGDRYFLLMASLGVDALVVAGVSPRAKRRFGRAAYLTRGLREALRFPAADARMRVDGEAIAARLFLLVAGNTRSYGGALTLTHHAVADDGLLDVVLFQGGGLGRVGGYLARALARRHLAAPGTLFRRARVVEVTTDPVLPVQADGELVGTTPARLTVVPGALRVIVPADLRSPLFRRAHERPAPP